MLNIFYCLVVAVHADIREKTDVAEQIVELILFLLIELNKCARVFASEGYLDDFASVFVVAFIRDFFEL